MNKQHGYRIRLEQEMFFDRWEEAQAYIAAMTKGTPVQPIAGNGALQVSGADISIKEGYFDMVGLKDE